MSSSFFPPTSGGSLAPVGLPDYTVYADPAGNNSSAGSQGAPKRTVYDAIERAISLGGGTVFFNDNTTVGGPVSSQGVWLRNDGVDVDGFLDIAGTRLRICPTGRQSGQYVFERPGGARMIGGSTDDYRFPGIWVVGTEVPIDFQFIKMFSNPNGQGIASPGRLGWDYVRDFSGAIDYLDITNGNRASQSTVFTVDLTTAQTWVVTSASRTSNITTIAITRPLTVAMGPWVPGSVVRVTTGGDPDFSGGDYTVLSQSDVLNQQGETTITLTYAETAANHAGKSISGTVKSHGCTIGDYVSTVMTSNQFVSCPQMSVTGVTATTITVFDPYGYGGTRNATTGNVANPGTLVKALRGREVASAVSFDRCSFQGLISSGDNFGASPALDLGGTSASNTRIYQCYFTGGNSFNWPSVPNNYDPSRTQVAILADPGGGTLSGASFQAYDCQSQSGHVVWNPRATEATVYIDQWLQDSATNALPTVVLGDGNTYASAYLDRIYNADGTTAAVVVGNGYDPLKVEIGSVFTSNPQPVINGSIVTGPNNMRSAYWNGSGFPTASPWALGWRTTWPGGLTTPHVGPNRSLGPVQSRFANLMPQFGSYVGGAGQPVSLPTGITITNDGLAPDGSSTAIKVVADNTYDGTAIVVGSYPATGAWSVGDYVAVGCWINSPDTSSVTGLFLGTYSPGDVSFDGFISNPNAMTASRNVLSSGWQWCVEYGTVAAITNGHYFIKFAIPTVAGTYLFYAPTVVRAPLTAGINDISEWAGTLKHQPVYLAPGMSGTMEGTKLIAHGGLGVSSTLAKTVGVGSGQLTLTGSGTTYVPIYAADGTTIQGWVAQLQATVNP